MYIIELIIGLLILALAAYLFIKKKRGGALVILFFAAATLGMVSAKSAKADTFVETVSLTGSSHYFSVAVNVNLNKSIYSPSEAVIANATVYPADCTNGFIQGNVNKLTATINQLAKTLVNGDNGGSIVSSHKNFVAPALAGNYGADFTISSTIVWHDHGTFSGSGQYTIPYTVVAGTTPTTTIPTSTVPTSTTPTSTTSCPGSSGCAPLPQCTFSASPSLITPPAHSVLTYQCTHVKVCSISGSDGSHYNVSVTPQNTAQGNPSVAPVTNTQYTLGCYGEDLPVGSNPDYQQNWQVQVSVQTPNRDETQP